MTQLTKSDYMLFLRHPAWLWLKKHDKTKLPPIDDNTQAIFDGGFLFEEYAYQLFPDGHNLGFSSYDEYKSLPKRTMAALAQGHKTLFQARFEHADLTCISDIIQVVGEGTIDLYEVKASTSVKSDHLIDLSFQQTVLEGAGLNVRKIFVIHVNNEYARKGDIDISMLTATQDVTADVRDLKEETAAGIHEALKVANATSCPDLSPSLFTSRDWLPIFKSLTDQPAYSIYDLAGLKPARMKELEDKKIKLIKDIPADFPLSEGQTRQYEATKQDTVLIEPDLIRDFLDSFKYPLYFLDYEAMASVIPYFDGFSPYKQVPFQYSLHVLDSPEAPLRHTKYLHKDNSDPVDALSKQLKHDIGTTGTVLTWNQSFERSCNTTMGNIQPAYKEFYAPLNDRIQDLMVPFQQGWYVHKDFQGSASIKKVLPVLVPDLSYAALGIHEGATAQRLWMEAVLDMKRPKEKDQILSDLDEYCALDTLAMIKIFEHIMATSSVAVI